MRYMTTEDWANQRRAEVIFNRLSQYEKVLCAETNANSFIQYPEEVRCWLRSIANSWYNTYTTTEN